MSSPPDQFENRQPVAPFGEQLLGTLGKSRTILSQTSVYLKHWIEAVNECMYLNANSTTSKELVIRTDLDHKSFDKGSKVADQEMVQMIPTSDPFNAGWNYSTQPRRDLGEGKILTE